MDLDSRSSGCARLGGGVGPPLGVVVEEVLVQTGGLISCQKHGFISPSTLPSGPLAIQIIEASKPIRRLKQRRAASREGARTPHGPALSPVISGQGRAQRKTRGHHAGTLQPRRRCSLLPTTKPAPRPSTRGHSALRALRDYAAAPPCTELRVESRRHRHAQQHSSGSSGDRDATKAQEKIARHILECFSDQRGSRNKQ